MDINSKIAEELNLKKENVDSAVQLLDEGNIVPFIARYRKEVTGGLNDEVLRTLEERLNFLRNLDDRKNTVYKSLEAQNIKDEVLLAKIDEAMTLSEVEDLYRPYKPKKVTRGGKAIKAGLKPLSEYIRQDKTGQLKEEAKKYICDDFKTVDKVIQGAFDIIAEEISDNANYRIFIKNLILDHGFMVTVKTKDATKDVYDTYADYRREIKYLKSFNILAINRAVKEECLTRKIEIDDLQVLNHIALFEISKTSPYKDLMNVCIKDSYDRLIYPSVCNDIYGDLMDKASEKAIDEFDISLKATLLTPPLKGRKILGFDPGFSHGCKLAAIDENGKLLDTVILNNPFFTEAGKANAKIKIKNIILKNKTFTIALGNGTASRESKSLLEEMKKENAELKDIEIVIVTESGASIWSATANASKEFPDLIENLRSAVSIARRLQDPLAEFVKIPPESIGVGQYQHDIEQNRLKTALGNVVEDCVNYVGVDLNTASASLLSYVAGINDKIAQNIVSYREENGAFKSRQELLKVTGLGPKAFLNCAGFLRIPESKEELDNSAVHPESYNVAKNVLKFAKGSTHEEKVSYLKTLTDKDIEVLAKQLSAGVPTLTDIIKELIQPSRDPRKEAKTAKLIDGIVDIKDLKEGMILEGTIRNVAEFGFFVDLGVETNGLVHISEISSTTRVTDTHQYGKPGDIIKVKVIGLDLTRKRISLSMKGIKQD